MGAAAGWGLGVAGGAAAGFGAAFSTPPSPSSSPWAPPWDLLREVLSLSLITSSLASLAHISLMVFGSCLLSAPPPSSPPPKSASMSTRGSSTYSSLAAHPSPPLARLELEASGTYVSPRARSMRTFRRTASASWTDSRVLSVTLLLRAWVPEPAPRESRANGTRSWTAEAASKHPGVANPDRK